MDRIASLIETESCILHPNRNPGITRLEAERELCHALGARKVIWLPGELSDGDCTDGHIDGLACFARPGLVLLETLTDPASERSKVLHENRRAQRGATNARGRELELIEIEDAWQAENRGDGLRAALTRQALHRRHATTATWAMPMLR